MRHYLKQSGQGDFKDTEVFLHNDMDGEMMVGGWLAGETLVQALSTLEWKQGRVAFMNSLYNQRRYIIDDLVIGDFGGDCSKIAVTQGAVCQCNQGGKTVYMKEVIEGL
ncbi:hypothetical protein [Streptomyces hygroscopicus]|uniref:hypothetical protein n=1 Tax=Streptomyces hygroscopicus TaxID=1912 RepID=UPI003F1AE936